jgi:hypothetical protein
MPTITYALANTPTAKWIQFAQDTDQHAQLIDRLRCFEALDSVMNEYRAPRLEAGRWVQPQVKPPHLLTDVARRANFASPESVYRRWRAECNDGAIPRWAGIDRRVKPRDAFVAEAKIVSFWPYRSGAMYVADTFEMTLLEVAAAYFRALGAWACDHPMLAALEPLGPPGCLQEDARALADRLTLRPSGCTDVDQVAATLVGLGAKVIDAVLNDSSMTPLGGFNTIRYEVMQLLAEHSSPLATRVINALNELADRLFHNPDNKPVMEPDQADQVRVLLDVLSSLLGNTPSEGDVPGPESACGA